MGISDGERDWPDIVEMDGDVGEDIGAFLDVGFSGERSPRGY